MSRWRISIAALMGLILACSVGLAALRNPTFYWACCVHTVALAVLLFATLGIIVMRGPDRASWIGMALFGWTYYLLSLWLIPRFNGDTIAPPYLAAESLEALAPHVGPPPPPLPPPGTFGMSGMYGEWGRASTGAPMNFKGRNWLPFRQIANSLGAVVFSLIGAVAGQVLVSRTPQRSAVA